MITLLSGIPGTGKTYYAVRLISKMSPDEQSKIIHNIDGLEIGRRLDDICKDLGISITTFLSESFQESNQDYYGTIIFLDEAQKIFPKRFNNQDSIQFFDLHRHYMMDIYLITQNERRICPDITCHIEDHFRAVPDSANPVPGTFLYKKLVSGEEVNKINIPRSKSVYSLYKSASFDKGEVRKKSRPMVKYLAVAVIASCAILFAGYRLISGKRERALANKDSKNIEHLELSEIDKKKIRDSRAQRGSRSAQDEFEETNYTRFNNSFNDEVGGVIYPVSVVRDRSGTYVILFDVMIEFAAFPYPLIKSRSGTVALLPADLAQAQHNYTQDLILAGRVDPNAGYYYEDSESKLSYTKEEPSGDS